MSNGNGGGMMVWSELNIFALADNQSPLQIATPSSAETFAPLSPAELQFDVWTKDISANCHLINNISSRQTRDLWVWSFPNRATRHNYGRHTRNRGAGWGYWPGGEPLVLCDPRNRSSEDSGTSVDVAPLKVKPAFRYVSLGSSETETCLDQAYVRDVWQLEICIVQYGCRAYVHKWSKLDRHFYKASA